MSLLKQESGFTLTEIIIALLIMVVGFLAMSQMQFLSLRQHRLAADGTIGTNYIQALSERDMAEIRRLHLLNARVYTDSQADKPINTQDDYCATSAPPCDNGCPCNPLNILTSNSGTDNTETSCAVIDVNSVDPTNVDYKSNKSDCTGGDLYLVRRVQTDRDDSIIPAEINLRVTYAVKTPEQFSSYNLGDQLKLASSVVVQNYDTSAHIDDWSQFVPGWTNVIVPHIP